ncbi:MAG TPA: SMP-30/gluconolactonase/LRE family protein [Pseudonocardiaceae bacterium]|nr:SMP-30/gluconolactonase/LRE family protein [Pseudonocardiaceae bacterium]
MTDILLTGLAIGESPRWHDGRLWLCDWCTGDIVTVVAGQRRVMASVPTTFPYSIDWLPDGRLLVVSGREGLLLRQEPDGTLVTHADLTGVAEYCNEIVVDGRGNTYLDSGTQVLLVPAKGEPREVATGLEFGNGMAVTPDNATLIVAESHGNRLTAFDILADGSLSAGRVWADLGTGCPDGICIDAEGAVWYADVPNKHCVRVREGGERLAEVAVDRGCFAGMLGGPDGTTLYVLAAEWKGMDQIRMADRTGQVLVASAPAAGAGWPAR